MLRRFLLPVLVFATLAAAALPTLAAYPEKPIRLIVPSAPGGAPTRDASAGPTAVTANGRADRDRQQARRVLHDRTMVS